MYDVLDRTDASETALGAVLTQEDRGSEKPVAYASRKLLPAERRCDGEDQTGSRDDQPNGKTSLTVTFIICFV
ncbi:hypothetical protein Y1Q_0011431 [Alligator mississippiensis]|uniref:Reverse transcriptase/retrotransposon-derived protein RNase H-like domain-containing protein n=1 Tax=Alligator mississippiensis TaxID=8496 RepID=A0A151LZQ3_ALLMI|nr:hypothetical protein Y1Q_0011431 [Alligator mississippiensis]